MRTARQQKLAPRVRPWQRPTMSLQTAVAEQHPRHRLAIRLGRVPGESRGALLWYVDARIEEALAVMGALPRPNYVKPNADELVLDQLYRARLVGIEYIDLCFETLADLEQDGALDPADQAAWDQWQRLTRSKPLSLQVAHQPAPQALPPSRARDQTSPEKGRFFDRKNFFADDDGIEGFELEESPSASSASGVHPRPAALSLKPLSAPTLRVPRPSELSYEDAEYRSDAPYPSANSTPEEPLRHAAESRGSAPPEQAEDAGAALLASASSATDHSEFHAPSTRSDFEPATRSEFEPAGPEPAGPEPTGPEPTGPELTRHQPTAKGSAPPNGPGAEFEEAKRRVAPTGRRDPLVPPGFEPEAAARALAESGATTFEAVEALFLNHYLPLRHVALAGSDAQASALEAALSTFDHQFGESYLKAFPRLSGRGVRPKMVLDAPRLSQTAAREAGASGRRMLLVDGLRVDIGVRVAAKLELQLLGHATLIDSGLLWAALPATSAVQLELLAKGADGLRHVEGTLQESELVARNQARKVRGLRAGPHSLSKLDIVEVARSGATTRTSLDQLAADVAVSSARFIKAQAPGTLVWLFGDHGFATQEPGAVPSPEAVLVPYQAWLVGSDDEASRG